MSSEERDYSRVLYLTNLSARVSERELRKIFGQHGTVLSVVIKNGFAFLDYEDPSSVDRAIKLEDGRNLEGQRIRVQRRRPGRKSAPRSDDNYKPMGNSTGPGRKFQSGMPLRRGDAHHHQSRDLASQRGRGQADSAHWTHQQQNQQVLNQLALQQYQNEQQILHALGYLSGGQAASVNPQALLGNPLIPFAPNGATGAPPLLAVPPPQPTLPLAGPAVGQDLSAIDSTLLALLGLPAELLGTFNVAQLLQQQNPQAYNSALNNPNSIQPSTGPYGQPANQPVAQQHRQTGNIPNRTANPSPLPTQRLPDSRGNSTQLHAQPPTSRSQQNLTAPQRPPQSTVQQHTSAPSIQQQSSVQPTGTPKTQVPAAQQQLGQSADQSNHLVTMLLAMLGSNSATGASGSSTAAGTTASSSAASTSVGLAPAPVSSSSGGRPATNSAAQTTNNNYWSSSQQQQYQPQYGQQQQQQYTQQYNQQQYAQQQYAQQQQYPQQYQQTQYQQY